MGPKALARRAASSLVVAQDVDELEAAFIAQGFEARATWKGDGATVPDGVYYERTKRGFVIWVPPDPQRSVGNSLMPASVEIRVAAHARGSQLEVIKRGSSHQVGMLVTFALLALTLGVLNVVGANAMQMMLSAGPFGLAALIISHQRKVAAERDDLALQALGRVITPLALGEAAIEDPYR